MSVEMPRKNRRSGFEFVELNRTLLGDDYKFSRDPAVAAERAVRRKERVARSQTRLVEEGRKNWTTCLVPDCTFQVHRLLSNGVNFPICSIHVAAIVDHVKRIEGQDQHLVQAQEAVEVWNEARRQARVAAELADIREYDTAFREDRITGEVYFVRINQLIKVGWSSDLHARLRSYGPEAELLAHYSGTRADEKYLHRQLTPSRAKGREWYHDDDILRRFITEALEKHGSPIIKVEWTKPGAAVRPRGWSGRQAS